MQATQIRIDDIPESGSKGFSHNGKAYFVVKHCGNIYVYENVCPHIGVALEWVQDQFLDYSRTMIQCANHGALFVIETGDCVSGPCSGQKLRKTDFSVADGLICLMV